MFERLSAYVIDPDDIARGLNNEYGITDADWAHPNRVEGHEVLNALSSEQNYGCSCYVKISIDNDSLDWAIKDYQYAVDRDWASDEVTPYTIRLRALKWLRNHIPLTENYILLEVEY